MNLMVAISFFLLSHSLYLTEAAEGNKGLTDLNIDEICKTDSCKSTIKSLEEGEKKMKPGRLAEKLLMHVQNEFGHTAIKVREHMEKDSTPVEIKRALSLCLKMYLDIAHELRGSYLAIKSRKYGPQATDFSAMTRRFPPLCEAGLSKVKTSGKKLGLYSNSYDQNDLTDMASALDAIIRYAANHMKKGVARR